MLYSRDSFNNFVPFSYTDFLWHVYANIKILWTATNAICACQRFKTFILSKELSWLQTGCACSSVFLHRWRTCNQLYEMYVHCCQSAENILWFSVIRKLLLTEAFHSEHSLFHVVWTSDNNLKWNENLMLLLYKPNSLYLCLKASYSKRRVI